MANVANGLLRKGVYDVGGKMGRRFDSNSLARIVSGKEDWSGAGLASGEKGSWGVGCAIDIASPSEDQGPESWGSPSVRGGDSGRDTVKILMEMKKGY